MKTNPSRHHPAIILALTTVLLALLIPSARAANFVMSGDDAAGTASFNSGANWTGGAAPASGNTYQTAVHRIRTPGSAANFIFQGDSLEIQAGGNMRNKTAATITITNFILADTAVVELSQPNGQNGVTSVGTLEGNITLNGTATFLAGNTTDSSSHVFTINSSISGSGGINTGTSSNLVPSGVASSVGKVILAGNNTFSGGVTASGLAGSTLQISGTNTYSGKTTVGVGTLALTGGALITNSASIVVASNAIFNVSGLTSAFTLAQSLSSQTLSNSAPGAIINGTNNCSAGTVSLVYDGVNPAFTITNGGMTLSAATTIKINNTGAQLASGSYKIIAKATAGNVGLVAGAVTASAITVGGSGAANTATLAITGGELWLNVAGSSSVITLTGTLGAVNTIYGTPSAPPTSFTVSGSNLGGAPGNLTVVAPTGYEVSLSSGSGYSTSLSVPYTTGTLASTTVYVRLTATATVPGSPYSGNITVSGGGATPKTIATATSTVIKVTPMVTVTVGSYSFTGFPQGPNAFTTVPPGDTGTATWEYVGVGATTYGPTNTLPAAAGSYTAQVALTADANFNSATSSPTAFSIANANVLFADDYTVSMGSFYIGFENTLGRQAGSLFPLPYLTRYFDGGAYRQRLGSTLIPSNTNCLVFFGDGGVRIDYDFSTNATPLEIRWSVINNWFGLPNTNSFTVGGQADGYDAVNVAFALQLRNNGTTSIFTNGVETAGAAGIGFADNILMDYKVILSDTNGTGSAFANGGSKAAYFQNGVLLGTANLGQLIAGQGYLGFVGGDGYNGMDNLRITAINPTPSSTNITYTVSGGQLVLNWPSGQGWLLQAQTNNLTSGLGTNWSTITGATPPYTNNINPANPAVFYRLKY